MSTNTKDLENEDEKKEGILKSVFTDFRCLLLF